MSRSRSEQVVPRITLNDILRMNDHKFQSVLHLKRGAGYAQYGGMPVIIESAYQVSEQKTSAFNASHFAIERVSILRCEQNE